MLPASDTRGMGSVEKAEYKINLRYITTSEKHTERKRLKMLRKNTFDRDIKNFASICLVV